VRKVAESGIAATWPTLRAFFASFVVKNMSLTRPFWDQRFSHE
jgi:hypothetical protein